MKQVVTTERIPIKLWLDDIEDGAMEQAKNLANLPFAFKHTAIMADAHLGRGPCIGAVLATRGVVIPSAVGVDISCGVIACKTTSSETDTETLKKIMGEIRKFIPVGFNRHNKPAPIESMPDLSYQELPIVNREYQKARESLISLGSGNHFIEIQKEIEGVIWIMIHSGSRNLGKQVADHYNKLAVKLNEKYYSVVDKKQELAFLPIDIPEAQLYLGEMKYCIEYARINRQLMLDKVCEIINKFSPWVEFGEPINVTHNYVRIEHHFGENVLVHRKGAISAKKDEIGIVPGSQGTKSYIVRGLGNPDSFTSCSHGAGRVMGRKDAIRRLNLVDEIKILDDQGIIHGIRNQEDLDEAPSSYKDINEVMKNQEDLVEIVTELSPIAVIKG
jgi:tRNA-splicing ligase RtcB